MNMLTRTDGAASPGVFGTYVELLSLVERLHRLLLDMVKDEFERLDILDLNAVQALLLFHVGENELTAGELKSRGFYQGSNVSYNLRKLIDLDYMHHQRSEVDRRSVRVRLTDRGHDLRAQVADLFACHVELMETRAVLGRGGLHEVNAALRRIERFWSDQIRYIY